MSGGIDSAVMLGLGAEAGENVYPLYVREGFVWEDEETRAVARYLEALKSRGAGAHSLAVSSFDVPSGYAIAWAFDETLAPPDEKSPDEAVYLPGRNLVLLTQAALLAHARGVERIQLGILAANPFPDATEAFFRSFEATVREAMNWRVRIETPLRELSKADVLRRGSHLPLELTLSCIRPRGGVHCGHCNKCAERIKAFRQAGIPDRTAYARVSAAAD